MSYTKDDLLQLQQHPEVLASPSQLFEFLDNFHKEKKNQQKKEYIAKDPERWVAYRKTYYQEHREKILNQVKEANKRKKEALKMI